MSQFVDESGLHVKGGDGGAGSVRFRREAHLPGELGSYQPELLDKALASVDARPGDSVHIGKLAFDYQDEL